jgi:protein SCO1/2
MIHRIKAGAILALIAAIALAAPPARARTAALVDQTGRAFTFASLRGEPLIVTFVAAHCTDACPLVNAQFSQAAQIFAARHVRAHLLTITLDPEHDPPAVMRDLARRFGADPRVWLLASGNAADVHAIMAKFGVVAERGRKGYADVHTTFVYIFDGNGTLRKKIFASTALGAQLASEVRS